MDFRKIATRENGFKGLECHYYEEVEKNGRKKMMLHKVYPKEPVHLGLEKKFKELRVHLLQICGLIKSDTDNNIAAQMLIETSVDTIELDSMTITIRGEKLATTDKYISLNTYKLEAEDGYEHYDAVRELVDSICDETKEYLDGTKKVEDIEAAIRWLEQNGKVKVSENGKSKELTLDEIKAFDPEKLREFATKLLENEFGSVVLHSPDIASDINIEGAVEELKTEFAVVEGQDVVIPVAEVKPKKEKKKKEQTGPHSPEPVTTETVSTEEEF